MDLWIKAFVKKIHYHVVKRVIERETEVAIQLEVRERKHLHLCLRFCYLFSRLIFI